MPLSVSDALKQRISTRAFLEKPVSESEVRAILEVAKYSPSGGNLQPWRVHVVTGAARARLIDAVKKSLAENPFAGGELRIYPDNLWEPYRTRRYKLGEDIYLLLSLPDDPQRYPVAGKVGWITPANASGGRTQGVGVRFPTDEKTRVLKLKIEEILGTSISSAKPTQTI